MRTLVLLRGAPGCGKTTWIREHGLSNYVVSSDEIRKLYASPQLQPDGSIAISQKEDNVVWKTLFEILEHRMQNGDFTVIDACNSKTSEMTRYRDLAHNYRYRIYCVDMTGIPIEEAKRRNKLRNELKWVPDDYIDRVYSRFETQQIPSGIVRVLPDEFENTVYMKPFDMSQYKQIVHVGDIHGCYDKLMEALPNGIEDNTGYIFIGDYCDRGPDSAKVIQYLLSIYKKPNVCLLEGNHERHLWEWANDRVSRSKAFEYNTRPQLERAGIEKKDVRELYRRMRQCSWYTFHGAEYLCTHAGISDFKKIGRLDLVPTREMIFGVGRYEDVEMCADSFESVGITQIFGHRNNNLKPTRMTEHSYCLEGGVERGGELRTVLLNDALQMIPHNYENPLQDLPIVEVVPSNDEMTIHDLVGKMRESKLI
ncbi:MAG: metallophosphoesterase, partial [Exiguobacterium sp.]|nr:metallophosphoesterase [Exiguobacterium sp.]